MSQPNSAIDTDERLKQGDPIARFLNASLTSLPQRVRFVFES